MKTESARRKSSEAFYALIKTLLSNLKITRGHCREESSRVPSDVYLDFISMTHVEPEENSVCLSFHNSIVQLEVRNTSLTLKTLVCSVCRRVDGGVVAD